MFQLRFMVFDGFEEFETRGCSLGWLAKTLIASAGSLDGLGSYTYKLSREIIGLLAKRCMGFPIISAQDNLDQFPIADHDSHFGKREQSTKASFTFLETENKDGYGFLFREGSWAMDLSEEKGIAWGKDGFGMVKAGCDDCWVRDGDVKLSDEAARILGFEA
ncbi:hypothetical protein GH714_028284 [Hevea brasiliensis]|uniref:Uncharacterized protein n=1 Tax=Hevea brasiliensis TaxID=3981 RepID=A0A6A6MGU5_HEVBR|nr:hypothetical protein GH714_028284 [Hevea brasiliensis]